MAAPAPATNVRSVLRAYARAARAHPRLLSASIIATFVIEAASIIAPLYLREFVDLISQGAAARALFAVLFALALVSVVEWFSQWMRMLALARLEAAAMASLYRSTFEYLLGHSYEFFASAFSGTLVRRLTRYARAFEQVLDNVILNFLPALLYAAGAVAVLSLRSPLLGAGLFVGTVVFVYLQAKMLSWRQPLRVARTEEDSNVTGFLSDVISNHTTVAAFSGAATERSGFTHVVGRWWEATKRSWEADAWAYAIQGVFAIGIEIGLLAAAIVLWKHGAVTVGDFVLIQVYVLGLMNHIWGIGRNVRQLYDAFAEAKEMTDILETPHAIKDVPGAPALSVERGAISFDNVHFGYPDGRQVLRGFNLSIAPHEKVALVGSSGAGKSTAAKLLLRFYDVGGGAIQIDGQNIAAVTQESLRANIAFVPQEALLFHRSLMENIRYGRPDASDEEILEAAKQAHCYEFIRKYEHGFHTIVGERGIKLSGGERQRVAIARAILKNAPILVLDEATSSLDSESETLIQDALAKLMKGKTVIVIAHRLSTVMSMDRIVVMEAGRVTHTGTHAELLAHESNLYRKLWEIQAGGFADLI